MILILILKVCEYGAWLRQVSLYYITNIVLQESQCVDCDGGYYCSELNATTVTGQCSAGYWCQSGVDRPNPDNDAVNTTYNATCGLGGHTGMC